MEGDPNRTSMEDRGAWHPGEASYTPPPEPPQPAPDDHAEHDAELGSRLKPISPKENS